MEGFQQTEEYNTVLFSWYLKGFELLRRYFIKHPSGVDLENLDLKEVDKEMAANEATHSSAPEGDAPEGVLPPLADNANAWACHQFHSFFFLFSFSLLSA